MVLRKQFTLPHVMFFLEWQVFAIWSEIVFKNTKKRFFESFFFIIHWDKFGFFYWKNKHTWKKSTVLNSCLQLLLDPLRGQSEPASMTAPVGRSVHRMGFVFHLPVHPTFINILSQLIFFACWPLTLFFLGQFFPNPDPPYHPPT